MAGENDLSFGAAIGERRREMGLNQKELAKRIKREDGTSISPQYLNDIEHDRRNPPSDFLLREFAQVLDMSENYLAYLAGRVPASVRHLPVTPELIDKFVSVFRSVVESDSREGKGAAQRAARDLITMS